MPLLPKRVKYRKSQRGSRKGFASRNITIDFGSYALQTLDRAWITNVQIEAAPCRAHPQHEAQGQALDPDLPRQVGHRPPARNANG